LFQVDVSPGLFEKKREKKGERNKKRIKKRKEKTKREKEKRERKKERVREPWLQTLKQLMHTNNQEAAPLPFQAFATTLRSALAHMHKRETYLASIIIDILPTDQASKEHCSHAQGKSITHHRSNNFETSI